MFDFFTKKYFLVDYLAGFIDMHNHILPGIDDGAKTTEESIEIINGFADFGVKNFICTPHIMHNYYPNTPESITASFQNLKKALLEAGMTEVSISMAAEHMIDDNFEVILGQEKIMPLRESYLLIEMSYLQPSINFETAIKKIQKKQLFSVLAHPERYVYLHNEYGLYSEYKEKGVLFQLNMLSLTGYYGKRIQKVSFKLLQDNMFDFIGSDVHNINQLKFLKKHVEINKSVVDAVIPLIQNTIDIFYTS